MRFGVGDFSGQRPPDSPVTHRQLYAELLEQAAHIEEVGLDSMWLSEHHFAEDGYMPAVLPIAAALLGATRRLTVATDRLAASLHDPVRLAEDAIVLDLVSGGRFILGLSQCYRTAEFAGFRIDPASDVVRLEALVPMLRAAFTGRPVRLNDRTVRITPGPHTSGGPPIMLAADGARGGERAGRLANLLMVDPTEAWTAVDVAVTSFDSVRANELGELVLFTYGAISEDGAAAAWSEVAEGFRYMRHTYDRWMGKPLTRELPPTHYRLLLGTPSEVAAQALHYARRYGPRVHLVMRCNYPGMSPTAVIRQIDRWATVAKLARTELAGGDQ